MLDRSRSNNVGVRGVRRNPTCDVRTYVSGTYAYVDYILGWSMYQDSGILVHARTQHEPGFRNPGTCGPSFLPRTLIAAKLRATHASPGIPAGIAGQVPGASLGVPRRFGVCIGGGCPVIQGYKSPFFVPARPSSWRRRRLTGPRGVPSQRSNRATPSTSPARTGHKTTLHTVPPFIYSYSRSTPRTRGRTSSRRRRRRVAA